MPPKRTKKKGKFRQSYQEALDAANAREYSTVQPHTTGKYGPRNVPTAPFAQPEKGTIG